MLAPILLPVAPAGARDLEIDAERITSLDGGTRMLATKARLTDGSTVLQAGEIIYDTAGQEAKARGGVTLADGQGTMRADRLEYFPRTGDAIARGGVHVTHGPGLGLWADVIRHEAEQAAYFLEGRLRLAGPDGLVVRAASLEYYVASKQARASGDVAVTDGAGAALRAATVEHDVAAGRVRAAGTVLLDNGSGVRVQAAAADYSMLDAAGTLTDVRLEADDTPGHFTADQVAVAASTYRLANAFFTSCDADDPAWSLAAAHLTVGPDRVARADGVSFRIGEVPVLYLPQFSHDFSGERRSGFLSPKLSLDDDGEFSAIFPYYLNLAPHYDAVTRVRIVSARGVHGSVIGRWLTDAGGGEVAIGAIDDRDAEVGRNHWALALAQETATGLRLDLEGSGISDDTYADDFFDDARTAQRHFIRRIGLSHQDGGLAWSASVSGFQTIREESPAIRAPFGTLPALRVAWHGAGGGNVYDLAAGFDRFRLDNDPANGNRWTGAAGMRRDILGPGGLNLAVAAGVAGARYAVARAPAAADDTRVGADGFSYRQGSSGWLVPHGSVEWRPRFHGRSGAGASQLTHMVEPRVILGLVAREDFTDIPVYDTARVGASYEDYFTVNPFAGGDRFEDGSFISYGLDTRTWRGEPGQDPWLSARVAQRYRLRDAQVQAGSEVPPAQGLSNALVEARMHPDRHTTVATRLEWNPDIDSFEQASFEAQYLSDAGDAYLLRYLRNRQDSASPDRGELGLGILRNLTTATQVATDLTHDLDSGRLSLVEYGMRHVSECKCWSVNLFIAHEPLANESRTSYSVQFDLLGLGGFGFGKYDRLAQRLRTPL